MTASLAPVLVVGGGPSGLTVALTLLRNGVPVRIVDKEPHYRIGQRSNGVWPRTFEVFHFLGVPEIHERSTSGIPFREYKPGTLEPIRDIELFPYTDPTPSIPYPNPRFFGQPPLEGILRDHLAKYGCLVELNTELQSFEQNDERVIATLVKKVDGQEIAETFEASYLVGADGGKGITRKQLGLTFLGETRDQFNAVIGDICMEVDGLDREHWHFLGDRGSTFISLRPTDEIAPDGYQFTFAAKDREPSEFVADEKLLFGYISELMGRDINVRKVPYISAFRPNIRMVDKFGQGRVFVVGDAAHVHSPTGGQGLNSCVQDGLNLGWKLSLVYKGLSAPVLLDSYNAERLPVIAEMLNVTTGILTRFQGSGGLGNAMQREKKLNMLGVNYRSSPIVIDEITKSEPVLSYRVLDESELVAGDRAPDAPGLTAISRLFDVFKATYHTVLVFSPDVTSAEDIIDTVSTYPPGLIRSVVVLPQGSVATESGTLGADVVVDEAGHAYRAYLVEKGEKKVVVVRPDGAVGAIVRGAEGVKLYFGMIFL